MSGLLTTEGNILWPETVVLGACGKMGRGIALLLLQQMCGACPIKLTLIDADPKGFEELRRYLRSNLLKTVEKKINALRLMYEGRNDLVDNEEMIKEYMTAAMDSVRCGCSLQDCKGATLIFEAIVEDVEVKSKVLKEVDEITNKRAFFFTNTSSIPISFLQKKAGLDGRLIGYHFYNPPAVQKLLEVVIPSNTDPLLKDFALALAKQMKKIVVISGDVAGFIGNGHFIREIVESCSLVEKLSHSMPEPDAIELVNHITQDYLVRPMGIFQLIDYVGIDVCRRIADVMESFLPGTRLKCALIEQMVQDKVLGGQMPDGRQSPGFFRYDKGRPVEVYDRKQKQYIPCKPNHTEMPEGFIPWKVLVSDPARLEKLCAYFNSLNLSKTKEAELARQFLHHSSNLARTLVKEGVAKNVEDVDTVLMNGFFHLYGSQAGSVHKQGAISQGAIS